MENIVYVVGEDYDGVYAICETLEKAVVYANTLTEGKQYTAKQLLSEDVPFYIKKWKLDTDYLGDPI